MHDNTTLNNMEQPHRESNIEYGTFSAIELYTYIITSICSFIGNLLVILTVYRNKDLRTSINCFTVNMSVSDILFPLFILLNHMFEIGKFSQLSKLVSNLLRKFLLFIISVSYGVSMLTLVVIAVYRFSAVMFPLLTQVQNKRKRFLVILLIWVIPMAMSSPYLVYFKFNEQNPICVLKTNSKQIRIWIIAYLLLFFFLPLLIMLVMYPLIIRKLKQHRVPGNVITLQTVMKRKRQNFHVTMMFVVLTVAFLLCWGPYMIFVLLDVIGYKIDRCHLVYLDQFVIIITIIFPAINPVIYFIFLSSFRQGFKNIFRSSLYSRTKYRPSTDDFELNSIPPRACIISSRL